MTLCDPTNAVPEKSFFAFDRNARAGFGVWLATACFAFFVSYGGRLNAEESEFAGLIRTKTADRGSYQAPTVTAKNTRLIEVEDTDAIPVDQATSNDIESEELIPVEYEQPILLRQPVRQASAGIPGRSNSVPRRVSRAAFQPSVVFEEYAPSDQIVDASCGSEPGCGFEASCGCEAMGYACDGSCMSCDSGCDAGCDSMACGSCSTGTCGQRSCRNCCVRLSMDPCQWFGAVELLLMWRIGEVLPPLATTSTIPTGDGTLGSIPTRILFGGERVQDEVSAGGRFTIGTWLDDQQCQSLVFRGWAAEQDSYGFATDDNATPIIARPFLNVGIPVPAQGSQIIASPDRNREGSININGTNDVYGADISLRQRWLGGLGGFVDVLYGYQYMRMDDSLSIATRTFETAPTPATLLNVRDTFDAENEFHGGQLGLAARYRERGWSFNGTLKAAAGSLRRTSIRTGSRLTTIGANQTPDPNGLLVRSTNGGTIEDNTFAWVPELDATIGWRWTKNLDLTFGYHVIAMTDSLLVSGMIDPRLAVNAEPIPNGSTTPPGPQNPSAALRYDTFYIHGIHFGVQCLY